MNEKYLEKINIFSPEFGLEVQVYKYSYHGTANNVTDNIISQTV